MSNIPVGKKCCIHNCTKIAVSKGLCDTHRKRVQRHGSADDSFGLQKIAGYAKITSHPLYQSWRNMERTDSGAALSERWKKFSNFVEDIGSKPDGDFNLARVDTTKPFSADNCYWKPITRGTPGAEHKKVYMREWQRNARLNNPDYHRNSNLKKTYGITLDDYNRMLSEQNGLCKICGRPERRVTRDGKVMNLHVDHCHSSNKVRGLLCHHCNVALGSFDDSIELLQSAIDYLNKNT
jgi:hypothetical protein